MRRTFPKPCYFIFFNFQENGFNYYFFFLNLFWEKNYMHLRVSHGLIVYKKNLQVIFLELPSILIEI